MSDHWLNGTVTLPREGSADDFAIMLALLPGVTVRVRNGQCLATFASAIQTATYGATGGDTVSVVDGELHVKPFDIVAEMQAADRTRAKDDYDRRMAEMTERRERLFPDDSSLRSRIALALDEVDHEYCAAHNEGLWCCIDLDNPEFIPVLDAIMGAIEAKS